VTTTSKKHRCCILCCICIDHKQQQQKQQEAAVANIVKKAHSRMVLSRTLLCCVLKLHVLCRIFLQQKCCNFGEISDETFDEICVFFMNASRFKPASCCNFRVAICVAILLQFCRPFFVCFCCFSFSSETSLRFRLQQSPRRPARRETSCVVGSFVDDFLTRFRAFF